MRYQPRLFDQPVEIAIINYTYLTQEEGYQIYALIKARRKQREIANVLERNESTIGSDLSSYYCVFGYASRRKK